MKKIRLILISLLILGLVLPDYSALEAISEEGETLVEEELTADDISVQGIPQNKPQKAEFVPGQLIVKLKEGKTVDDIADLNAKYGVTASEKVFPDTPAPEQVLNDLKAKYNALGRPSHDSWYWQLDKDSKEYKEYIAKIEKEKEELKTQIQAQEELIAHLAQRQKRAPEGIEPPRLGDIYVLTLDEKSDIETIAQEFAQNPNLEYAQPSYILRLQQFPNDPYVYGKGLNCKCPGVFNSWGIEQIGGTDKIWGFKDVGQIIVAVIDSGVDFTHPDLAGKEYINRGEDINHNGKFDNWPSTEQRNGVFGDRNNKDDDHNGFPDDVCGWHFSEIPPPYLGTPDTFDQEGHGTAVSGVIAAVINNRIGIAGMASNVKIMPIFVSEPPDDEMLDRMVHDAIIYAVNNGADIINMSIGFRGNKLVRDAVQYATRKGCIVVVAAGNEYEVLTWEDLSGIDGTVVVGAVKPNGERASFSNYGMPIDVVAPGFGILTTVPKDASMLNFIPDKCIIEDNGVYAFLDGTSFAAPYVTGLLAKYLRKYKNNQKALDALFYTAIDKGAPGWDPDYGHGLISADVLTLDEVPLRAKITKVDIDANAFDVFGIADGEKFREYTLEYSAVTLGKETQEFSDFVEFKHSHYRHTNEFLGHHALPPGRYIIKLTVFSKDGKRLCDKKIIDIKTGNPPTNAPIVYDEGEFSKEMSQKVWWEYPGRDDSTIVGYQYRRILESASFGTKRISEWEFTYRPKIEKHIIVPVCSTLYWEVRAKNNSGLYGPIGRSDGIVIDTEDPKTNIHIYPPSPFTGRLKHLYNCPVRVELNVVDTCSGVPFVVDKEFGMAGTFYSIDGSPWSRYEGPFVIDDNGYHRIRYYSEDRAGNKEPIKEEKITIDTKPPRGEILINKGAPYTNSYKVTLNLKVKDNTDISSLIEAHLSNDRKSWVKVPFSNVIYGWELSPQIEAKHTVFAQFVDAAGNFKILSDDIIVDTTPPEGKIDIVEVTTNTRTITLNLDAYDSLSGMGPGAEMWFREQDVGGASSLWVGPEPYASTKTFILTTLGAGWKDVSVIFKDAAGNWGYIDDKDDTDSVFLKETTHKPPTGSIKIDEKPCTTYRNVNLVISAVTYDNATIDKMQLKNEGESWSNEMDFCGSKSWDLSAGYGTKKVYVRLKDSTGAWSVGDIYDTIEYSSSCSGGGGGGGGGDCLSPVGSVLINNSTNSTTKEQYATVTFKAEDSQGIVLMQIYINDGGGKIPLPEESFVGVTKLEINRSLLLLHKGTYTLWVKYKNKCGSWSPEYTAKITKLD